MMILLGCVAVAIVVATLRLMWLKMVNLKLQNQWLELKIEDLDYELDNPTPVPQAPPKRVRKR